MPKEAITAVKYLRHSKKTWTRFTSYRFAQSDWYVPLAHEELQAVALDAPIAFIHDKGRWQAVALMGPKAGRNVLIDANGNWLGRYVPAKLRSYPFSLAINSNEMLCIDEASGLVSDRPGNELFFDESGNLTPFLLRTLEFLRAFNYEKRKIASLLTLVEKLGLLSPWETEEVKLNEDIYQVDEAALHSLPDSALLQLKHAGAISLLYSHFVSKNNWKLLLALSQQSANRTASTTSTHKPSPSHALAELHNAMMAQQEFEVIGA